MPLDIASARNIQALVIDPHLDFCDRPPGGFPGLPFLKPALPVPGAWDDLVRLAALVDHVGPRIKRIHVTLDSHHQIQIFHAIWWMDSNGNPPPDYTTITVADVELGRWTPRNPMWRQRSLEYVRKLAAQRKYELRIWPLHCLIGSLGHAIHPVLFAALSRWEEQNMRSVNKVTKGSAPFTEHYSAMAAEVPDPTDPTTMLNGGLIDTLQESDLLLLAGEAKSHCLKATVTDIADRLGEEHIRKFVLLSDCTSSIPAVPGGVDFPKITEDWVASMQARGMKVATSTELMAA